MIDPAIDAFFSERKENWLKDKKKANMSKEDIATIELECETRFALETWLPDAAKRAGQISISTHPCTFSHSSARKNKNGYASSIIAEAEQRNDGLLRTGNVDVEADALGNAAALDVYKFLTLTMNDGQTLLDHVKADTSLAKSLLNIKTENYDNLKMGFLQMITPNNDVITSSKIKQVYYLITPKPEQEEYHLLSLLTHSGHLFELRKRIDNIRFSEETKQIRELKRKNEFSEQGFKEIYDITTIGFGGTQPQNISVKCSQNAGKAHLLISLPPQLEKRNLRLPRKNFFFDTLNPWVLKDLFNQLSSFFNDKQNNYKLREKFEWYVEQYIDHIIFMMWKVRAEFSKNNEVRPQELLEYQKIWLFPENKKTRNEENEWLLKIINDIAQKFIYDYQKIANKEAITLGDGELERIITIIRQNKDELK